MVVHDGERQSHHGGGGTGSSRRERRLTALSAAAERLLTRSDPKSWAGTHSTEQQIQVKGKVIFSTTDVLFSVYFTLKCKTLKPLKPELFKVTTNNMTAAQEHTSYTEHYVLETSILFFCINIYVYL